MTDIKVRGNCPECPLCSANDISSAQAYVSKSEAFGGMEIVKCMSCEMIFAWPPPSAQSLEQYNSGYFDAAHGGVAKDEISTAFFKGIAAIRVQHVLNYARKSDIKISRVLEIGPGTGFFAREWLAQNPNVQYSAIETDSSCHEPLNEAGINVRSLAGNDQEAQIDLIVMSHVLEHVSDPESFVADATKKLRPGGALFIEVPCRDHEHKEIHEPHLLFFDKKQLGTLLGKTGFLKINLSYHGHSLDRLSKPSFLNNKWNAVRMRLIKGGIVWPFSGRPPGLRHMDDPLVRAVVAPHLAHIESDKPAWWLRGLAVKGS